MAESAGPRQTLCFRNVSIHSRGDTSNGTLYLERHHLRFKYYSNTRKAANAAVKAERIVSTSHSAQSTPTISAESSTLIDASAGSARNAKSGEAHVNGVSSVADNTKTSHTVTDADARQRPETNAQRPKESWIAYSLINSCILRPSHSVGQTSQNSAPPGEADTHKENDLFPPVFGTSSSYGRPSSDSTRAASYASSPRPASPSGHDAGAASAHESGRQPAIRVGRKDFSMMAIHFHSTGSAHSPDDAARQVFYELRNRCCVDKLQDLHAFYFHPPKEEVVAARGIEYDARREFARMGISGKAAEGPGSAWRLSEINQDYSYSATYPSVLCVPQTVSDNTLKYGGEFRSRCRIPSLTYLHSNGGSISRSSQPLVGIQNKRNIQDERLVSAIFSSHTPPIASPEDSPPQAPSLASPSTTTLVSSSSDPAALEREVPSLPISHSDTALNENVGEQAMPNRKKIYGSTRRNLIIDARPKVNAHANRVMGGGIEDVAHYKGSGDVVVERVFLDIENIHTMRSSLDVVIKSFANSDYIDMKPDPELLRKSAWLSHIAGMLDGAEMVARVVGLGGSHVLIHCSDGWDRTAQVAALTQIMLDPHYRTLEGFISLVQKDFLSYGHKFRDRDGIEGSEKWFDIENERVLPSRNRENNNSDNTGLNAIGAKAISGAKNWIEKRGGNLFRQQNSSSSSLADQSPSRPSSPPPNSMLHSSPKSSSKEEKEHRMSEKEVSPMFHQFLDATYQLLHQNPNAFEFNERFLRRLFYHTYACQYGEFLFNTERERNRHMPKLGSVWGHFLSRKQEFVNPDFVATVEDPLLFPRKGADREVHVRWWSALFGRKDEEMNLPRALAPANPPAITPNLGSAVSFDSRADPGAVEDGESVTASGGLRQSKSTQSLSAGNEGLADDFASLSTRSNDMKVHAATGSISRKREAGFEILEKREGASQPALEADEEVVVEKQPQVEPMLMEYDGDPLGVTSSTATSAKSGGLDFAAFASQNAYRDK